MGEIGMAQRSWMDALTDGQILRDWLSLFGSLWFSLFYISLLALGYGVGIGLSLILIGLPLLLFTLAGTRPSRPWIASSTPRFSASRMSRICGMMSIRATC